MLSLEKHRAIVREHLPKDAFLRLDREDALFATDAPRFMDCESLHIQGYSVWERGGILHITPDFADAPVSARTVILKILKTAGADKDRLIRSNLALAMREHDTQKINIFREFLEGEEEP